MVKLIGIIIGIIAVVAFLVVAFVFVDRLIFEGDTLFGKQESMVDEFDKSQNISQSTIAASEQFEMIKPIETSSPLSMEKNRNSVTRYLKELEQKRRVVNFDRVTNAQPNVPDLNITIMENLSEVYLQSVKQDLRRRGFSDILIHRSPKKVFFYGLKDESEQIEIANILFQTYSLQPVLGDFR